MSICNNCKRCKVYYILRYRYKGWIKNKGKKMRKGVFLIGSLLFFISNYVYSIEHFEQDELVFIGSNIPHVWYNMERKYIRNKKHQSVSLSLFISPSGLIKHLDDFGDTQGIKRLFLKAQRGMMITGQTKSKLISLLKSAINEKNI